MLCEAFFIYNVSLCRETGSHSFAAAAAAAADGQLPEVPSALLQDTIEERWVPAPT